MNTSTRRIRQTLFALVAASAAMSGVAAEPHDLTFVRKTSPYDRMSALTDRCLQAAKAGDMDHAAQLCRAAVQVARKKDDRIELGMAYSNLAAITWFNGDTETAKAMMSRARELSPELGAIAKNAPTIDGMETIRTANR